MVAFKVESWIWYSVVLTIAISRLYALFPFPSNPPAPKTLPKRPNPPEIESQPIATYPSSPMQITDENPNAAFRAVWPSGHFADTRPTITL